MTIEFKDIKELITELEYNTFMKLYSQVLNIHYPIIRNKLYRHHIDDREYVVSFEEATMNELPKYKFISPYQWEVSFYPKDYFFKGMGQHLIRKRGNLEYYDLDIIELSLRLL